MLVKMDNKTLTCFALFLLLGCALGKSSRFRRAFPPKRPRGIFQKKGPTKFPTDAPGNCDPKNIPRFPDFDPSVISNVTNFVSLITPQTFVPIEVLGNQLQELVSFNYFRPDKTREQIIITKSVVALGDGTCANSTTAYKFGRGRDSATFSRVQFDDGVVNSASVYVIGVDIPRGERAFYFEVLLNGVYDNDLSFILITTRNPSQAVDLRTSAVREGLVQFCGEEVLEEDFFQKVPRNDPVQCNG